MLIGYRAKLQGKSLFVSVDITTIRAIDLLNQLKEFKGYRLAGVYVDICDDKVKLALSSESHIYIKKQPIEDFEHATKELNELRNIRLPVSVENAIEYPTIEELAIETQNKVLNYKIL